MPSLGIAMMMTIQALRRDNPDCAICRDTGWDTRRWRVRRCECTASGMSAFGQDPKGLEAKPASPTAEGGDAQTPPSERESGD
jgi:hypothetical protein